MGTLISECYVIRFERTLSNGTTLVTITPVIFMIKPSLLRLEPGEDVMTFSNVFDANKFIKNNCIGVRQALISREAV